MGESGYALLVDFGSTFTKLTAVCLESGLIAATAAAPTTVSEGIEVGLAQALEQLDAPPARAGLTDPAAWRLRLACSSAAGGLRVVAVGLVPELTAKAARTAALGAGARVEATYSYELSAPEVASIEEARPDIVILCGGTDGGNRAVLMSNAEALAASRLTAPTIVAGNKAVSDAAARCLRAAGKEAMVAPNVLPELGRMDIDPVRGLIRDLFMERIVEAKGLDSAKAFVGGIVMPTPAAVLEAARLLSAGHAGGPGLGDLLVVDPGGATTDVHSVADGLPTGASVVLRGLQEPRVKRTVEGDLGLRHSGGPLAEAMGIATVANRANLSLEETERLVVGLKGRAGAVAVSDAERALDEVLAAGAVGIAVSRHAGTLETAYTPLGALYIQRGKDLTGLRCVIGSGGPVVHSADPVSVLRSVLFREDEPTVLRPKAPRFLLDSRYILSAMGLLAGTAPALALAILKRELVGL